MIERLADDYQRDEGWQLLSKDRARWIELLAGRPIRARDRQRVADISHELRTPLAVRRAELEALQDGVGWSTICTTSHCPSSAC